MKIRNQIEDRIIPIYNQIALDFLSVKVKKVFK